MKKSLLTISAFLIGAVAMAQTPVASYMFNDGTTNDGIGTNHATNHGATLVADRFGVPNSAFDFHPSNEAYISIPSTSELTFGQGDFTISLWFKSSAIGSIGVILNRGQGTTEDRRIFIRTNTPSDYSLQWRLGDHATNNIMTDDLNNPSLFDGQWHHLVLVRSTENMKFYVDGFFEEQLTAPLLGIAYHDNSRDFLLGVQDSVLATNSPMANYFDGSIDDVQFFDEELDIQDIIELYGEQTPVVDLTDDLLAQWSFNNGTPEDDAGFNDGVNFGSTLTNDRFGNPDNAYAFQNSYIEVDHSGNTALSLGTGNFSISTWFKTDNTTDIGVLINKGQSTSSMPRIFIRTNVTADNSLQYRIGNGNTNVTKNLDVTGLYNDTWQHIVLVKWLNHMKMYVNGVLVDDAENTNLSSVNVNSNRPFLFGAQDVVVSSGTPVGSFFDGSLDDIRIYGRAINDGEALELYNQTNPETITGNADLGIDEVMVYPNPCTDVIRFDGLNAADIQSVEVYEMSGRLVESFTQPSQQINVSELKTGLYLVSVIQENGSRSLSRITKQ